MNAVALYEENESIKKTLLPLFEEMFTFVYKCKHLNSQINHSGQQKRFSDYPLNQNHAPMEHFSAGSSTL